MKLKNIFLCWDFITATAITLILWLLLPSSVAGTFAKDIYGIAIPVLSIVFSVYFAALAIIISSGDNDFISFLEEDGSYTEIINSFKYSLIITLISLVFSILLFGFTSYKLILSILSQNKNLFAVFVFLFSYSLFTVFNSSMDAITYVKYRIKFTEIKRQRQRDSY
ncbi:hypothetical protein JOC37_001426 [Desulfohalotomaculum tongense]|uniref:hypothetical protein n=1 Tax=Desulforadius tongensis TaxID=1216062 RepID=UPI00195A0D02|nr:hypothetical protein [Desulforadius tongensis]MBM7855043.1 hypothetical protein [Desulforadius tongensis]